MSTLLLRFAGPMQSWGRDSKYDVRRTQREPTKSGVIGMLAAALGRKRDADLSDLTSLKFGVRTDRQGKEICDYHIVRKFKNNKLDSSYVTYRYYLSDAVFLVGLESDDDVFLQELSEAINCPAYPLFLGRRSCPPEGHVNLGIVNESLYEALTGYPLLVKSETASYPIQIMCDTEDIGLGVPVNDLPVSFSPLNRQFAFRLAEKKYLPNTNREEHDPMLELR